MSQPIKDRLKELAGNGKEGTIRSMLLEFGLQSKIRSLSEAFPIASILVGLLPFGGEKSKSSESGSSEGSSSSRHRSRGL